MKVLLVTTSLNWTMTPTVGFVLILNGSTSSSTPTLTHCRVFLVYTSRKPSFSYVISHEFLDLLSVTPTFPHLSTLVSHDEMCKVKPVLNTLKLIRLNSIMLCFITLKLIRTLKTLSSSFFLVVLLVLIKVSPVHTLSIRHNTITV